MHRIQLISTLIIGLFFSIASSGTGHADSSQNVCVECHKNLGTPLRIPVEQWLQSVHKRAGVTCVNCHGGDPTSRKRAMETSKGFRGVPLKDEIPDLCGGCHSDARKMRKFNLRTDQLSAYKTSKHGMRLFQEDDENVATCIDCHNAHDVQSKDNPASPVYRFNIPDTCNRCHGDEDTMEEYNIPMDQYKKYSESVHGKKFFKEQNLRVPTCSDCHGSHGAAPPGIKEVSFVCGNCHAMVSDYFRKSPHWSDDNGVKKPHCVNCHGNHNIQKPGIEKFSSSSPLDCGSCHKEDSKAYKVGLFIQNEFLHADTLMAQVTEQLHQLKNTTGNSFITEKIKEKIEKAQTLILETKPVTHTLSKDKVHKGINKADKLLTLLSIDLNQKSDDLQKRRIFLICSWALILILVFLIKKIVKTIPNKN